MTLMTTMTAWWLLRFFVYDKKKAKPDALSSARLFLTILTLATILSRVSRVKTNLKKVPSQWRKGL